MVETYDVAAGAVGATLFGGDDIRTGTHEGYRMDLGMWLDAEHRWGVEANYFDITGRPDNYDSGLTNGYANGAEFPVVRTFYDTAIPGDTVAGVGFPGLVVGRVMVETSDYFQSAGLWLRYQVLAREWSTNNCNVNWTDPSARTFRVDAIGGYRFARLLDAVNEQDGATDVTGTATNGDVYSDISDYQITNTFNGGELGFDAVYTVGRWSLDCVGKVALGVNHQYASVNNLEITDASNQGGGITTNGLGFQTYARNRFSAIPQVTLTAGYQLTDHLKVTAGYDLLYWTAVVRAADQIPVGPDGYPLGSTATPPTPLPPFAFNESHFLAQGLHLGAEVRY